MPHILIADEDQKLLDLLSHHLMREGYQTTITVNGEEALAIARRDRPDLILLELLLPSINGFEITRKLKCDPETRSIPIIIVTDKGEESDIIAGYNIGATDYITKPFSIRVLLARVRTILRRTEIAHAETSDGAIRIKGMTIWPQNLYVTVDGRSILLTPLEFEILALLARQYNRYFTRVQIIDAIRGEESRVTERSIDVHISGLRKKLGTYGDLIETVHHLGYRIRQ